MCVEGGGEGGTMRDNLVEILFQSFLQEVIERASSSGKGKDIHSLTLSLQYLYNISLADYGVAHSSGWTPKCPA